MPRYVAFLRGVSPTNAKMPELKKCVENAGFSNVRTVLASGNVVFDVRTPTSDAALERKLEMAMESSLPRVFPTIVRRVDFLETLLASDPYAAFKVGDRVKRVVSFLRTPKEPMIALPLEAEGARVLCKIDREVFTVYIPGTNNPIFMTLIEKAFGKDVTTRTWDTLLKCVKA